MRTNRTLQALYLGSGNLVHGPGIEALADAFQANQLSAVVEFTLDEDTPTLETRARLIFALRRQADQADQAQMQRMYFGRLLYSANDLEENKGMLNDIQCEDFSSAQFLQINSSAIENA